MLMRGLGFTQPLPTSSNRFQQERTVHRTLVSTIKGIKNRLVKTLTSGTNITRDRTQSVITRGRESVWGANFALWQPKKNIGGEKKEFEFEKVC
jgi:hypothetical protein